LDCFISRSASQIDYFHPSGGVFQRDALKTCSGQNILKISH